MTHESSITLHGKKSSGIGLALASPTLQTLLLQLNIVLTHRCTTYDDTLGLVQKRSVTLNSRHRSHTFTSLCALPNS